MRIHKGLFSSPAAASLLVASGLLGACGGAGYPRFTDVQVEHRVLPVESTSSPEIDALASRFYGENFDAEALSAELEAALAEHPHEARLHEMAALVAELREDTEGAWLHWLSAAADTTSPFALIYLDRAFSHDRTTSQETTTIRFLERVVQSHPDPAVRADAASRLVTLYESRERFDDASELGQSLGLIRSFRAIGPFDNDQGRGFLATHPPETTPLDFDTEMRGLLLPVRWRDTRTYDRSGHLRLRDMVAPSRWAAAYLVTHVRAEQPGAAQLRIGTDSGVRAWLNGRLVVSQEHLGGSALDDLVVPIELSAGWNRLLIKSTHRDGPQWTVGARITDLEGRPRGDLVYSADFHEVQEIGSTDEPVSASPLESELASVQPPLRRVLLTHHDAVRNGFEGDALSAARELLQVAPEHPVVLYHSAVTHWTNDELGRAQDLLNQGADRYPQLAGFLLQRGQFYRERDRFDRAIEDLQAAMEANPRARLANMLLAETFEARGWREQMCRHLSDVQRQWPDSGWAIRMRGSCLQNRGYLDRAERLYRRADALEPGHVWNLRALATLARWRQDHDSALRAMDRLRRLAPWNAEHIVETAHQHRYAGHEARSRELLREAIAQRPGWARPHHHLAEMAFDDGDLDAALGHWQHALARDPDNEALAERIDFYGGAQDDADRELMPSAEQIESALASRTELEVDPGAHTVLLLDDEVTTVQQDGSATRRVTQVQLAVTTDGRDDLIRNSIPPRARILQAYAVSANGSRQEASSIRGGTVRFRGLDVGSAIVLQYVHHAQPPAFLPNHFVSSWLFQGVHRQLVAARWVVQVPHGRQLAMHIQGPVEHEVQEQGELDVHTFTASRVAPLVPEPAMPPVRDLIAMVTLSTLTDWGEYVEWERALLSEVFEANPQVRQLAQRLTEGASTPRERLDRIFHYVAQEIRYQQDYEDTIAGVRPHSCPIVLERGYGDCKDKAVLMILLARELGIDVHFAVLRTTGAGQAFRDVPNQQFNHAIVYVPAQEGIEEAFFMDPTTDGLDLGNLRSDDQGAEALVLDPQTGAHQFVSIPYQDASMQFFRCGVEVTLQSAESAQASSECRVRGTGGATFRRVMRNEEQARQLYQNVASAIFTGATVTEASAENATNIREPVQLNLRLDASPAIHTEGEELRMRVPGPFPLARVTRLESRRTPIRLGPPDSQRWEVVFVAPPGGRIVRTPSNFDVRHACFSMRRRTTRRGNRATVVTEYERTCSDIAAADYAEFRRQAQRAANQLQADVIFSM